MEKTFTVSQVIETVKTHTIIINGVDEQDCNNKVTEFINSLNVGQVLNEDNSTENVEVIFDSMDDEEYGKSYFVSDDKEFILETSV